MRKIGATMSLLGSWFYNLTHLAMTPDSDDFCYLDREREKERETERERERERLSALEILKPPTRSAISTHIFKVVQDKFRKGNKQNKRKKLNLIYEHQA